MVEVQKDPMDPPKFRVNKKIPRGPPSPPAPVMHSPNRKVSVKEQAEWKIPPCISNWKNAKVRPPFTKMHVLWDCHELVVKRLSAHY